MDNQREKPPATVTRLTIIDKKTGLGQTASQPKRLQAVAGEEPTAKKQGTKTPVTVGTQQKIPPRQPSLQYDALLPITPQHNLSPDTDTKTIGGPLSIIKGDTSDITRDGAGVVSFQAESKNLPQIIQFRKELMAVLALPPALIHCASSGKATARFGKTHHKERPWQIKRVVGDPYMRAVLYDALQLMLVSSPALKSLDGVDYEHLLISVGYRVLADTAPRFEPIIVEAKGNQLRVTYQFKNISLAWGIVGSQNKRDGSGTESYIDFLALGGFLFDAISEDRPEDNPKLARLRQSPAFTRPIR